MILSHNETYSFLKSLNSGNFNKSGIVYPYNGHQSDGICVPTRCLCTSRYAPMSMQNLNILSPTAVHLGNSSNFPRVASDSSIAIIASSGDIFVGLKIPHAAIKLVSILDSVLLSGALYLSSRPDSSNVS